MPPPTTVDELLDRVRRSGIVSATRLERFLSAQRAAGHTPATPADLLGRLAAAGLITRFHAEKLAAGKYRGFQLGSYLVLDQIGSGGMGQVYLAEHVNLRRLVALKVLPPQAFEDAVSRERFFREARAAGALDHPNVVRVFDLCQDGKLLFLVMEYVDGVSLQAVVGRHGPLPVGAACHYARQVAFGLQHAHDLGMVHRDIKPANLLLDRAGVVKILDLGLVRSEADADSGLTNRVDGKTILGTADYLAPEQAVDSSKVDIRADLYSLGATLYFLLAGRPLFPDGRTAQKLVWQQIKEPDPVDRVRPGVPPGLTAVVHRLLAKKPAGRYQTPAEVFDALAPFVPEELPPPDPAWLPNPSGRAAFARPAGRAAGSASRVVEAAMRGASSATRPGLGAGSPTVAEADEVTLTAPERPGADLLPVPGDTERVVIRDTRPATPLPPDPAPPPTAARAADPTAVITALSVALVLALLGIVVLLIRG
ncbi:MAG: serine/threonine protein kinase [Isosphaera sp.]|nr:serine/threonine protein kinase [Isosphaera sp.]